MSYFSFEIQTALDCCDSSISSQTSIAIFPSELAATTDATADAVADLPRQYCDQINQCYQCYPKPFAQSGESRCQEVFCSPPPFLATTIHSNPFAHQLPSVIFKWSPNVCLTPFLESQLLRGFQMFLSQLSLCLENTSIPACLSIEARYLSTEVVFSSSLSLHPEIERSCEVPL